MMRYGIAMLATSCVHHGRPSFAEDVAKEIKTFLTRRKAVPEEHVGAFREYLLKKPGSPRYSPLRRAFQNGQSVPVEHQDLLLSDQRLPSSVGALTQDYFDDALGLAHALKLVERRQNLLLARGRLCLSTGWERDDPFVIGDRDAMFLGLWLLDVDCDWVWAFLSQLPEDLDFEITAGNRVQFLLDSWKCLLTARGVKPGQATATVRMRLNELLRITERNVREKLNLGQPWSWFLVPRLELLVDAGISEKDENGTAFPGTRLTAAGQSMRSRCLASEGGEELIAHYFSCHDSQSRPVVDEIEWDAIRERVGN